MLRQTAPLGKARRIWCRTFSSTSNSPVLDASFSGLRRPQILRFLPAYPNSDYEDAILIAAPMNLPGAYTGPKSVTVIEHGVFMCCPNEPWQSIWNTENGYKNAQWGLMKERETYVKEQTNM